MSYILNCSLLLLSLTPLYVTAGQCLHPSAELQVSDLNPSSSSPCAQPAAEREAIIRKADQEKYTLRRIEFTGNINIRDDQLRRRLKLPEGDLFSRRKLMRSLAGVNKYRKIYPVRMRDVMLRLDDRERLVDVSICFREKPAAGKHAS